MAYSKQTWHDEPVEDTPISAARLGHIEDGIEATASTADTTAATVAGLGGVYQPLDSDLTAIAALSTTLFGRSLLAQADAAATRTTLALGTAATADTGTTSGTLPLLSTGGVLPIARLATGTPDGTKFIRDDGTLVTPSAGGVTQSYLGTNAVGGTLDSFGNGRNLLKKITLSSPGLIASIDIRLTDTGATSVGALCANLYSDVSGTPTLIDAVGTGLMNATANTMALGATSRWVSFGIGAWRPAGDYWISIGCIDAGSLECYYDTGGSDKYYDSSGSWIQDPNVATTVIDTTKNYSIRASILR